MRADHDRLAELRREVNMLADRLDAKLDEIEAVEASIQRAPQTPGRKSTLRLVPGGAS